MYTCVCVSVESSWCVPSCSSEKDEATKRRIEARVKPCKRERKGSDDTSSDDSEDNDDDLDEDYRMSTDDEMKAEWKYADDGGKRSYTTRRNAKIPHGNVYFPKRERKKTSVLLLLFIYFLFLFPGLCFRRGESSE